MASAVEGQRGSIDGLQVVCARSGAHLGHVFPDGAARLHLARLPKHGAMLAVFAETRPGTFSIAAQLVGRGGRSSCLLVASLQCCIAPLSNVAAAAVQSATSLCNGTHFLSACPAGCPASKGTRLDGATCAGPKPTRLRYCMNAAAMTFIPRKEFEAMTPDGEA